MGMSMKGMCPQGLLIVTILVALAASTAEAGGSFAVVNLFNDPLTSGFVGGQYFAADFDGDGNTDLGQVGNGTLGVVFSEGDGIFRWREIFRGSGLFPSWAELANVKVLVADFNNDGRSDIALTGATGWTTLPLALSNGDGTFVIKNETVLDDFPQLAATANVKVLTGDFNGDGKADLALTGVPGWTKLPVALSTGYGKFDVTLHPMSDFAGWAASPNVKILVGDFNRDRRSDIALAGVAGWTTMPVAYSDLETFRVTNEDVGDFAQWAAAPNVKVLAGDFNDDGRTDVVLTGVEGWTTLPVAFTERNGKFRITNQSGGHVAFRAGMPNAKAWVGDFDDDGKDDLVLTGVSGTALPVAFSWGDGDFDTSEEQIVNFAGWASIPGSMLHVGDFNGDRKTDLALTGLVFTGSREGNLPVAFSVTQRPLELYRP